MITRFDGRGLSSRRERLSVKTRRPVLAAQRHRLLAPRHCGRIASNMADEVEFHVRQHLRPGIGTAPVVQSRGLTYNVDLPPVIQQAACAACESLPTILRPHMQGVACGRLIRPPSGMASRRSERGRSCRCPSHSSPLRANGLTLVERLQLIAPPAPLLLALNAQLKPAGSRRPLSIIECVQRRGALERVVREQRRACNNRKQHVLSVQAMCRSRHQSAMALSKTRHNTRLCHATGQVTAGALLDAVQPIAGTVWGDRTASPYPAVRIDPSWSCHARNVLKQDLPLVVVKICEKHFHHGAGEFPTITFWARWTTAAVARIEPSTTDTSEPRVRAPRSVNPGLTQRSRGVAQIAEGGPLTNPPSRMATPRHRRPAPQPGERFGP